MSYEMVGEKCPFMHVYFQMRTCNKTHFYCIDRELLHSNKAHPV